MSRVVTLDEPWHPHIINVQINLSLYCEASIPIHATPDQ